MDNLKRRYLQFWSNTESSPGRNDIWNHFRKAAAEVRRFEDVFEDALNIHPRTFVSKNTQSSETKVQRPDVIQTKDVIGMAMRDQNRIEMLQTKAQRLLTKISRRVDEHG